VPAFEFIVLKPIKIGDKTLEPGEVTIEPNTWSARTLKVYTDGGYIHYGQAIPEGFEPQPAFTGAPPGYEEREPFQPRVSTEVAFEGSGAWRCWNCRRLCHLPEDLGDQVVWQCWSCGQQQTIAQVADQQHPVNVSEEQYRRSITKGDPTDWQQEASHPGKVSAEALCKEPNCIRPLDHSGNHRNAELREWERKPSSRPVRTGQYSTTHLDARSPIDPAAPIPGRR
jgi:hypothetical protein